MGTLSKNIDRYGRRIGSRVGDLRTNVSHRFDDIAGKVDGLSKEEGGLTRMVEKFTAALPSSTWLALAGVSLVSSLGLHAFGRQRAAHIVGEFVPAFLLVGIYNKLVKIHGSDRFKT